MNHRESTANHRGDIHGFQCFDLDVPDLVDWGLQIGDLGGNRPTEMRENSQTRDSHIAVFLGHRY